MFCFRPWQVYFYETTDRIKYMERTAKKTSTKKCLHSFMNKLSETELNVCICIIHVVIPGGSNCKHGF